MGTFALISLIFAIVGTAASIGAGIYSNQQNRQIAERNWEEANESREDNQQFEREQQDNANRATIDMFNAIDSPAARRAQLENAGLSVGLMYGGGGQGGGGHASATAAAPAGGAATNAPFINPILDMLTNPMEALEITKNSEKTEKETKKIEAETDRTFAETKKIEEEAKTEVVTQNYTATQTKLAEMELVKQGATIYKQIELIEKQAELINENIIKTRSEIRDLDIKNEYAGKLYESTLNMNEELTKKYVADTAKTLAEVVLIKAETKLKEAQTNLTEEQKIELEQKVRQARVIANEYESYGYKTTEANNWATELMSIIRQISSHFGIGEDFIESEKEKQKEEAERMRGMGMSGRGGGAKW